jgi:endonuclease YncB( thermonuclease family)
MRIALALCIALGLLSPAVAGPIEPADIRVIDGDTILAHGQTYRLVGFDAPETGRRSKCDIERALGHIATDRLRELIDQGGLDLTEVRCSCPTKSIGTRSCNYGRLCGTLTAQGKDVGATLISEGFARPLRCTTTRCAPLQSWCRRIDDPGRLARSAFAPP